VNGCLEAHLFETARKQWGMVGLINPLKSIRKPSASNERDRRSEPSEFERISAELLARRGDPYALPAFELAIEPAWARRCFSVCDGIGWTSAPESSGSPSISGK
jgi:hypothetical protein